VGGCFWLFAAAHGTIWTILPFALYANLPLDIIEDPFPHKARAWPEPLVLRVAGVLCH
jgi:hypothetical protein